MDEEQLIEEYILSNFSISKKSKKFKKLLNNSIGYYNYCLKNENDEEVAIAKTFSFINDQLTFHFKLFKENSYYTIFVVLVSLVYSIIIQIYGLVNDAMLYTLYPLAFFTLLALFIIGLINIKKFKIFDFITITVLFLSFFAILIEEILFFYRPTTYEFHHDFQFYFPGVILCYKIWGDPFGHVINDVYLISVLIDPTFIFSIIYTIIYLIKIVKIRKNSKKDKNNLSFNEKNIKEVGKIIRKYLENNFKDLSSNEKIFNECFEYCFIIYNNELSCEKNEEEALSFALYRTNQKYLLKLKSKKLNYIFPLITSVISLVLSFILFAFERLMDQYRNLFLLDIVVFIFFLVFLSFFVYSIKTIKIRCKFELFISFVLLIAYFVFLIESFIFFFIIPLSPISYSLYFPMPGTLIYFTFEEIKIDLILIDPTMLTSFLCIIMSIIYYPIKVIYLSKYK